ncbi:hypothetical protein LI064_02270 [Clostridium perfringens]|uniref:hypothetical protein n=1 Tax=Clostridium perfringens TaxID=1502 RepID=UPI0022463D7A|nr:hypothetical protein [Clostridium perfringens]MCX0353347.1 hypothetical protein [Clostridium perfringens]
MTTIKSSNEFYLRMLKRNLTNYNNLKIQSPNYSVISNIYSVESCINQMQEICKQFNQLKNNSYIPSLALNNLANTCNQSSTNSINLANKLILRIANKAINTFTTFDLNYIFQNQDINSLNDFTEAGYSLSDEIKNYYHKKDISDPNLENVIKSIDSTKENFSKKSLTLQDYIALAGLFWTIFSSIFNQNTSSNIHINYTQNINVEIKTNELPKEELQSKEKDNIKFKILDSNIEFFLQNNH